MSAKIKSIALLATIFGLSACTASYDDYGYEEDMYDYQGYYDSNNVVYDTNYAHQQDYEMQAGITPGTGCMPGYGADMTAGGLRTGRYGQTTGQSYSEGFSGKKSRYGSWHYSEAYAMGCAGGYWILPTYHIIETPPPPTVEVEPPVVIEEPCPEGQYRMDNGNCAIMITEEPEQYEPPVVIGYPEIEEEISIEWYEPKRK